MICGRSLHHTHHKVNCLLTGTLGDLLDSARLHLAAGYSTLDNNITVSPFPLSYGLLTCLAALLAAAAGSFWQRSFLHWPLTSPAQSEPAAPCAQLFLCSTPFVGSVSRPGQPCGQPAPVQGKKHQLIVSHVALMSQTDPGCFLVGSYSIEFAWLESLR